MWTLQCHYLKVLMWMKLFYVHVISIQRSVHPFAVDKMRHGQDSLYHDGTVPILLVSVKQPCHEHQPFMILPAIWLCVFQELFIIAGPFTVGSSAPSSLPICLPALSHNTFHSQPRHWAQWRAVRNWSITRQTRQKLFFLNCQAHKKSQETVLAKWAFPLAVKVSFLSKEETFCEVFPEGCWLQPQLQTAKYLLPTLSQLFHLIVCTIWAALKE